MPARAHSSTTKRQPVIASTATIVFFIASGARNARTVARLAGRIRLVSGFLRELCEVIEFGAGADGAAVLAEIRRMPQLLDRRTLKRDDVEDRVVRGSWRRLVYGRPPAADGTIDSAGLLASEWLAERMKSPRLQGSSASVPLLEVAHALIDAHAPVRQAAGCLTVSGHKERAACASARHGAPRGAT
jgi:hypothetical protein